MFMLTLREIKSIVLLNSMINLWKNKHRLASCFRTYWLGLATDGYYLLFPTKRSLFQLLFVLLFLVFLFPICHNHTNHMINVNYELNQPHKLHDKWKLWLTPKWGCILEPSQNYHIIMGESLYQWRTTIYINHFDYCPSRRDLQNQSVRARR